MAESRHAPLGYAFIGVGGAAVVGVLVARLALPKGQQFALSDGWPIAIMAGGAALFLLGLALHFDWFSRRRPVAQSIPPTVGSISGTFVALRDRLAREARDRGELERVSRRLGTELREMRLMIERVKATNPMAYPRDFRLPVARWEESEDFLSNYESYTPVERAYGAAKNVNDVLRLREARLGDGARPLGVIAEDGLDEAHGLAGEALDALGERHNDSFKASESAAGDVGQADADRAVCADFGDRLTAFWAEREHGRPQELDMFSVGTTAKNARDAERVAHDEDTVRLYLIDYSQEAVAQVRKAIAMHLLTPKDEQAARDPESTNDIARLAARLAGLKPPRTHG